MRAGSPLSWITLLSLTVACADDAPANATDIVTGLTTTTAGTPTSGSVETATGASGASGDGETTSVTSTEFTGTSVTGTSATGTTATSTTATSSTGGDESSTGEPQLPGCGDTPPEDFHAEPSAPADDATVPAPSATLEVTIGGTILADATADFHLRQVHTLSDADDFTIVILPDTADRPMLSSEELAELFIVSDVLIDTGTVVEGPAVIAHRTDHRKCGRCWRHLPEVTDDGDLCARCEEVVA